MREVHMLFHFLTLQSDSHTGCNSLSWMLLLAHIYVQFIFEFLEGICVGRQGFCDYAPSIFIAWLNVLNPHLNRRSDFVLTRVSKNCSILSEHILFIYSTADLHVEHDWPKIIRESFFGQLVFISRRRPIRKRIFLIFSWIFAVVQRSFRP